MDKKLKIGLLISGRGTNMVAIMDAIDDGSLDAEIQVVVSNRPDAKGLTIAQDRGFTTFPLDAKTFPSKVDYEQEVVRVLKGRGVEFLVLAGYMQILGPDILKAFTGRIINIHPSLLPAFKGLRAQRQAMEAGVKFSGCTVHFVDESLDGGPIISQEVVPVLEDDTEESLADRILLEEHKLYPKVLQLLAEGRLVIDKKKVRILGKKKEVIAAKG